jgi:hypothetical protein
MVMRGIWYKCFISLPADSYVQQACMPHIPHEPWFTNHVSKLFCELCILYIEIYASDINPLMQGDARYILYVAFSKWRQQVLHQYRRKWQWSIAKLLVLLCFLSKVRFSDLPHVIQIEKADVWSR